MRPPQLPGFLRLNPEGRHVSEVCSQKLQVHLEGSGCLPREPSVLIGVTCNDVAYGTST